jgi:hypothetical protein
MTLRLNGDSSGFTEIKAADIAGDNSIKLPASNGSANQLLKNGSTAGELEYSGGIYSDSDNVLLIGKPTTGSVLTNGVELHSDVNSALNQPALQVFSYTDTDALRTTWTSYLQLNKSRAAQPGENGAVALSDYQGMVRYSGDDGTNFVPGSEIFSVVEGAVGTNVMPSKLVFATNGGAASTTPRVEIGSNGALKLLAGCPGIDFSGTQGAAATGVVNSETLGNYEAGQWVPTISSGSTPSSTLNIYRSAYTRVGRLVTLQLYVNFAGGDSGTFQIGNLPFAVDNTTTYITGQGASNGFEGIGSVMIGNFNLASTLTAIAGYAWTNYIRMYYTPPGVNQSWIALTGNEIGGAGNGGNIIMTITYITDDD